jgi:hypothetical protein
MRRLYEAADRIEAQRLVDFLRDHHIPAIIPGDYLSGAAGELPVTLFPAVWIVEETQWYRARALLAEFLAPAAATGGPWRCPNCSETVDAGFEVCWNCGTARNTE